LVFKHLREVHFFQWSRCP